MCTPQFCASADYRLRALVEVGETRTAWIQNSFPHIHQKIANEILQTKTADKQIEKGSVEDKAIYVGLCGCVVEHLDHVKEMGGDKRRAEKGGYLVKGTADHLHVDTRQFEHSREVQHEDFQTLDIHSRDET